MKNDLSTATISVNAVVDTDGELSMKMDTYQKQQ